MKFEFKIVNVECALHTTSDIWTGGNTRRARAKIVIAMPENPPTRPTCVVRCS